MLQQITLAIEPGEAVALLGPSGSGKTTLLNVLNGTLLPTTGSLEILGQPLPRLAGKARRQLQRQIGTVYQRPCLTPNLSVLHNLNAGHLGRWSFWQALWSLIFPLAMDQARDALEQVGLAHRLHTRADRLSGGQQQRVALARVLIQNPTLVLADEPTASLDPESTRQVMELVTGLRSATPPRALVISLHQVELARRYCDRIVGLRQGTILFDLPTAQVEERHFRQLYQP